MKLPKKEVAPIETNALRNRRIHARLASTALGSAVGQFLFMCLVQSAQTTSSDRNGDTTFYWSFVWINWGILWPCTMLILVAWLIWERWG